MKAVERIAFEFHRRLKLLAEVHGYDFENHQQAGLDWRFVSADYRTLLVAVVDSMLEDGVIEVAGVDDWGPSAAELVESGALPKDALGEAIDAFVGVEDKPASDPAEHFKDRKREREMEKSMAAAAEQGLKDGESFTETITVVEDEAGDWHKASDSGGIEKAEGSQ